MNLSRRHLVAAGATTLLRRRRFSAISWRRATRQIHLQYANNLPRHASHECPGTGNGGRHQAGHPNGAVRSANFSIEPARFDTDTLSQKSARAASSLYASGLILATLVPAASINGMASRFHYDTVWKAMDGDLGAYVRAQIAKTNQLVAMEKIGTTGFSPDHPHRPSRSRRRRFSRHEAAGLPRRRVDLDVQSVDAAPASINFQRSSIRRCRPRRRRPGESLASSSTAKLYEVQKYIAR